MSDLSDRMSLIKSLLEAAFPTRIVTRDLLDFSLRKTADLEAGIYSLVSQSEGSYQNYSTREGMDGKQRILLVGQILLGEDVLPSVIEDAEFSLVDEIKGFLRTRDPRLAQLFMNGFKQSQQMEAPYGWVAIELEFLQ